MHKHQRITSDRAYKISLHTWNMIMYMYLTWSYIWLHRSSALHDRWFDKLTYDRNHKYTLDIYPIARILRLIRQSQSKSERPPLTMPSGKPELSTRISLYYKKAHSIYTVWIFIMLTYQLMLFIMWKTRLSDVSDDPSFRYSCAFFTNMASMDK